MFREERDTITVQDVRLLQHELARAPGDEEMSAEEALQELVPALRSMRGKGYPFAHLAAKLRIYGLGVSERIVRRLVGEAPDHATAAREQVSDRTSQGLSGRRGSDSSEATTGEGPPQQEESRTMGSLTTSRPSGRRDRRSTRRTTE